MILLIILASILLSTGIIYLVGRTFYNHEQLDHQYGMNDFLLISHVILGLIMACFLFIILNILLKL
jgi:hypothetical protein